MYRYAATRNRVHRVFVDGNTAFKVEQCNLDDAGFLNLVDEAPDGTRCKHCWRGWTDPDSPSCTPAQAAANDAPPDPAIARRIPLVTSTRRMAIAALVAAAVLGTAVGVLASPDPRQDAAELLPTPPPEQLIDLDIIRELIDDRVTIALLEHEARDHVDLASAEPTIDPIVTPAPDPTPASTPTPAPKATSASTRSGGSTDSGSSTHSSTTTTIIVVQPAPTPAPTVAPPAATPPPCVRPGNAQGIGRRCGPNGN